MNLLATIFIKSTLIRESIWNKTLCLWKRFSYAYQIYMRTLCIYRHTDQMFWKTKINNLWLISWLKNGIITFFRKSEHYSSNSKHVLSSFLMQILMSFSSKMHSVTVVSRSRPPSVFYTYYIGRYIHWYIDLCMKSSSYNSRCIYRSIYTKRFTYRSK